MFLSDENQNNYNDGSGRVFWFVLFRDFIAPQLHVSLVTKVKGQVWSWWSPTENTTKEQMLATVSHLT